MLKSVMVVIALFALAAPALAAKAPPAPDRIILPSSVIPTHYDIAFTPDMKALTFIGHVDIDLQVKAATRTIALNAADMSFAKVSIDGRADAPKVKFDTEQETATLAFAQPIAAGKHRLHIDYTGKITENPAGLFSVDYKGLDGKTTRALFTQFENSDARRFVPSWDEPNRKATFTLTATVPTGLMPVSNMPVASTKTLGGGLSQVRFSESPKMSSYLLFFGLGDFERIHENVDGTDVGVIFKRGDTASAKYALDAESHILRYYNDYFGVKFPLPKLDMIAGPGQSQFFGAMENWGAIFYFERDVLIDPKTATEADKQNVYITVAHETAHQWFGDLVTMDWWTDLWLNEGFASWMENKATDHFHPEWKLWLQALGTKQGAMSADSRVGTHPIITPIRDVLQANQAFDTITYSKGQAVIRMLEAYVGEDAWRAGVRRYIKKHAYGNTTTDDLWREIDAASPRKLTAIAHDFTLQDGVPLITVGQGKDGVQLTQGRFGVDEPSKEPRSWRVPVTALPLGGTAWRGVVSEKAPVAVPAHGTPVLVNAGQTSYFRTLYTPPLFAGIAANYAKLSSEDQLGILNDAGSLGLAGYEPLADELDLIAHMPAEADPVVASAAIGKLQGLDGLYDDGDPGQAPFRAAARRLIAPLFARLGWDPKPGESDNTRLLRTTVIRALGGFDDPAVLAEARTRFQVLVKDPHGLEPGIRRVVLSLVATHADAAAWEQLHQLARTAPTPLEKEELYRYLAAAHDKALAQRALDLALSDEPEKTTGPSMIGVVSGDFPDLAFDYALSHQADLNSRLEPDSRNQFVPRLASNAHDLAMIAKLDAYADKNIPATARSEVVKAESTIRYTAKLRDKRPEIDAWVKGHGG